MNRANFLILRWVSIIFIFLGVLFTVSQLISYSRQRTAFAAGTLIAGIPVSGLDRQEAAEKITQVYNMPVEIHYADARLQIKPSVAGFKLDLEAMLTAADQQRVEQPFWNAFFDYLWNRQIGSTEVPLRASISAEMLKSYLGSDIAARYDRPPSPAAPVPGATIFQPGQAGITLDLDRAVILIEDALRNPVNRVVNLTYGKVNPSRPSFQNLQVMLQQVLQAREFDGIAELYLLDLQTGQEINFAFDAGDIIAPGIAFTAASTMKIPIMVSIYNRIDEPAPAEITNLIASMIELSENDPADRLMEEVIDDRLGPLEVSADIASLGLENTFLAGFFYPGAPLLRRYSTPANKRTDVSTDPDPYNQTSPTDMGMLLSDIYYCANDGGGTLPVVFPEGISQSECRVMISYLSKNRIAVLFEAGLPEGVQLAHKHGWMTDALDGLIHTISDAGIIYTPGGDFVLVVYLYHPVQLLFDPASELMAAFSQSVYNYYNQVGQ